MSVEIADIVLNPGHIVSLKMENGTEKPLLVCKYHVPMTKQSDYFIMDRLTMFCIIAELVERVKALEERK